MKKRFIWLLIFAHLYLVFIGNVFGVTIDTTYVNTDSTPGGDGTTNATEGANRAYASLNEWENAEDKDLVSADEIHHVFVSAPSGVRDTQAVYIAGWVTDSTRFIRVECTQDAKGVFDTTIYFLDVRDDNVFRISEEYTEIIKIQTRQHHTAIAIGTYYCFNTTYTGVVFDRCIATIGTVNVASTANARGFNLDDGTDRHIKVLNCLVYDLENANGLNNAGYYANTPTNVIAYYCNVYNCGWRGFATTTGFIVKNCISDNNDLDYAGGGTLTTCLSSDGTGSVGLQNKNPTYVDESGKDFHLQAGSDGLNSGTDLSADAIQPINTDVDGDTRNGTPDIGYDELAFDLNDLLFWWLNF